MIPYDDNGTLQAASTAPNGAKGMAAEGYGQGRPAAASKGRDRDAEDKNKLLALRAKEETDKREGIWIEGRFYPYDLQAVEEVMRQEQMTVDKQIRFLEGCMMAYSIEKRDLVPAVAEMVQERQKLYEQMLRLHKKTRDLENAYGVFSLSDSTRWTEGTSLPYPEATEGVTTEARHRKEERHTPAAAEETRMREGQRMIAHAGDDPWGRRT